MEEGDHVARFENSKDTVQLAIYNSLEPERPPARRRTSWTNLEGKERDRLNDTVAELNGVIREKDSSIKELEKKLEKADAEGNDTRREFELKLSALEAKIMEAQKT
uniref:Uncharacterized protein n=1 Tax=Parascaris equorum TaxID=6256 RepID=A0A914RLT3_PAREQ